MTALSRTTAAFRSGLRVGHLLGDEAIAPEPARLLQLRDLNCPQWDRSRLYLEAHITVEPSSAISFDDFRRQMADDTWRVSAFSEDDVDQIVGKWFITCRHESLAAITVLVRTMVADLRARHLTVLRYKIEDTLLDSKHGDTL